jgi:hypothetical protein
VFHIPRSRVLLAFWQPLCRICVLRSELGATEVLAASSPYVQDPLVAAMTQGQVMSSTRVRRLDLIAATGLGIGAVFGMAGTLVSQAPLRQMLWAIDGVGLIVASALLTVRFVRTGDDCVAAGFLVFALGESLLLSGTAAGLAGSIPSFGGGVALWAAALLLISIPAVFATWVRVVGVLAAGLFVSVAMRIFSGEQLLPTSSPMPFFAYPFLVLTFAGWITALLEKRAGKALAGTEVSDQALHTPSPGQEVS